MVRAELELIIEVQTDEFWQDITTPILENVRKRLRKSLPLRILPSVLGKGFNLDRVNTPMFMWGTALCSASIAAASSASLIARIANEQPPTLKLVKAYFLQSTSPNVMKHPHRL